jgi:AcrR family transcriptional regulator
MRSWYDRAVTEPSSLRERKKQRTRALIRDTALELFATNGYEATTIKSIAEAADVASRTVTLHFPAKDDLLFVDDDPFPADRLADRLADRPSGQTALAALRNWMIDTIAGIESDPARARRYWRTRALRARLITEDAGLRGRARASYAPAEQVLAAAIAQDLGLSHDALFARLAAQTAITGLHELYDSHEAKSAGPNPTAADLTPLVEHVIAYAAAGLQAAASAD